MNQYLIIEFAPPVFLKKVSGKALELAGMDLAQLREEVNKLYKGYAGMGNNPPAIVILDVIPRMRKKVPPANLGEENLKKKKRNDCLSFTLKISDQGINTIFP